MISKERLQEALVYLAETDEECAQLRANHARAEFKAKAVKNALMGGYTGTVADRQAESECATKHVDAKNDEFDLFMKYEAMKNKRATQSIIIDTWRSLNAGRNRGQII